MKIDYSLTALRDLSRLPKKIARRITDKMKWYAMQDNPLSFAKALKESARGDYRFRVSDYRVLVEVKHNVISILIVLAVRHRKDAYRL